MPIDLITGPANAGKAQLVMDAMRRHIAHGQEPMLVVPTRADAEHYLAELTGEGVAMGARVERFAGLIALAVARAGLGTPPLGAVARRRVLAALAAEDARAWPSGEGFYRALTEIIGELRARRVSPARLREAVAQWQAAEGPAPSGAGLAELYARYCAKLAAIGRADEEQLAHAALEALRERPALWGSQPVLFYGFDDLTSLQLQAIETIGSLPELEVTVSLAFERGRVALAGRAGAFHALHPLAREHRELRPREDYYAPGSRTALSHLERRLFEPDGGRVAPGEAVRLLEGGGERAELELVAGEIRGLIDRGVAPEQIAVVMRGRAPRLALLREVFSRAGVPCAIQRPRQFGSTALGAALIGVLRCAASPGHASAGELLAWLRAPGLLERPELADDLERRARLAGGQSAAAARALWEARHWPLERIDRLAEASPALPGRDGSPLLDAAERELARLFAAPRRGAAQVLSPEELDEGLAFAAARRALADLRELARLDPALAPGDPGQLAEALAGAALSGDGAPGEGSVAVLDPLQLRARRVRALFLCGLQEGVFPSPAPPPPFLGEQERRALADAAGLRLADPKDALAAERYLLYATVSRPEQTLYLSWHLADDDGQPSARSLFVDDICDLFTADLAEARVQRPLGQTGAEPEPAAGAGAGGVSQLRDAALLAALHDKPWSASSLEAWISCPARWFMERLLAPGDFEPEPEPLARGGLAHEALKDTFEGLRSEFGSARLTAARLARAQELLDEALRRHEPARPLSVLPERATAARRRLQADLHNYLRYASELESPLEPTHLEMGFGFEREPGAGPQELPPLDLGDGVRLRGRIDRVDISGEGQAVLYDYKGREVTAPARWVADGKVQMALYMTAVRELLGLDVVGGFYQPLAGADLRARGLLDADSAIELACVGGDTRPRADIEQLVGEAVELARLAAQQARRGDFQSRPHSCGWNQSGCAYPGICRCET